MFRPIPYMVQYENTFLFQSFYSTSGSYMSMDMAVSEDKVS